MQDQKTQAPEARNDRAAWVEPTIVRLEAGSAELSIAPTDDTPDYS
jgi:hypothetical protein